MICYKKKIQHVISEVFTIPLTSKQCALYDEVYCMNIPQPRKLLIIFNCKLFNCKTNYLFKEAALSR